MNRKAASTAPFASHWTAVTFAVLLLAAPAGWAQVTAPADAAAAHVDRELAFASGLVAMGLPDYADRVLNKLVNDYPDAKARAAAVRIQVKTARGQFTEAEKLIATMPPTSMETLGMKLALGDAYYLWNKLDKAREIYDAFFQLYTNGPPAELKRLYAESAYKYAQMLMNKGDEKGALRAYHYVLLSKPESDVERRVQTEMAELCLKLGTAATGDERQRYFKEARDLCAAVQWKGTDLFFGQTVVILAHIQLVDGHTNEARKVINDYMPMLKEIDDLLRRDNLPLKYSPMAQCRFLLGTMDEAEGYELYKDKSREADALKALEEALRHLYTVFLHYTSSEWAPEAGKHADAIVTFLESKGHKVKRPTVDMGPIIQAQIKEAAVLYQEGNYQDAAAKYADILATYPTASTTLSCLDMLARCYIREGDDLYARVVYRYIAERFSRNDALKTGAGDALANIAATYEEENKPDRAAEVYGLLFDHFPEHEKVPVLLFRMGDSRLRREKYNEALPYYQRIAEQYQKARIYPDALNRLAFCQTMIDDHTNAIKTLTAYVAELQPGAEKISATLRLGDEYRLTDQLVGAINEYARLINYLDQERAKYSPTTEDDAKNRKALERAMFWKPFCYSRLKTPADKVALYQGKAIEGYQDFLKAFSTSDLAPSALSGLGTLLFLQNKPAEAGQAYERLSREFPNSEQAKNVLFAQGQSLIDIGQTEKAIQIFERMFNDPKAYSPAQFLQVGRVMLDAGQYEPARRAYAQARASEQRDIWEAASIGLAKACLGQGKYHEAVVPIEDVLNKFTNSGYTVEGSLLLSRAYAEIGNHAVDEGQRAPAFAKALQAMATVRQYARDPETLTQADFELAALQSMMGRKNEALASYQRIFLLGNANDAKIRPYMEKAFEKSVPLLIADGKYVDVVDNCEAYLKAFPQGRLATQARQWRDEMKMKGVHGTSGAETP